MADGAYERVGNALRFVEENLGEPIMLDNIAESVGLTKYHLHRVFRSMTGMPLMEYVRARRLSNAAHALASTDLRVLDIAVEFGFGSESSFSRAFREFFGITTLEFRRTRKPVPIMEPARLDEMANTAGEGMVFRPRMVVRPSICLVGIEHAITDEDDYANRAANKVGLEFFTERRGSVPNRVPGDVYQALVRYKDGSNTYMPSVETPDLSAIPQGMTGWRVPSGKYAVFEYIGFHPPEALSIRELADIYGFVFRVWLPQCRPGISVPFHLERIDRDMCREDYCSAEIHVPVMD